MDEIIGVIIREGWYNFLWKPAAHFVSSGFVGLLVYWLTLTMLSHLHSGQQSTPRLMRGAFSIHQFSLLLACSFAVFVHILEDYTLNWF